MVAQVSASWSSTVPHTKNPLHELFLALRLTLIGSVVAENENKRNKLYKYVQGQHNL